MLFGLSEGQGQGRASARPSSIPHDTPPIFLAHASDDRESYGGSLSENSAVMYLALKRAGVSAELHIYRDG